MRLFTAITLDGSIRDALLEMQDRMRWKGVRGNYTRPENLHLTLAFIGEYPDPDYVKEVIESVAFDPFDIVLDGAGSFRGLWWAGVSSEAGAGGADPKSDPLFRLVRSLRHALADGGIPFDRKKFSPHITLVRRPEPDYIAPPAPRGEKLSMTVERISLMRSVRGKSGMIYTEL